MLSRSPIRGLLAERCAWYGGVSSREKSDAQKRRRPDEGLGFVF